jgi:hypothetical protein
MPSNMTIEWNKVTWYSKLLAIVIFVTLPFAGFILGVKYQEMRIAGLEGKRIAEESRVSEDRINKTSSVDMSTWNIYRNEKYGFGFEFKYPNSWVLGEVSGTLYLEEMSSALGYPTLTVHAIENFNSEFLSEIAAVRGVDIKRDCRTMRTENGVAYDCYPTGAFAGNRELIMLGDSSGIIVEDQLPSELSSRILSTFKFTK